ncbi:MAG: patatin-like phospholipase family protein [Desulfobacterales bacterium]|nr:patatin-like phospholipase family protein [Desulfobacterales bacterium]
MKKLLLSLFAVFGTLMVTGWILFSTMRSTRPPAPPAGSPITYPWGAMHLDDDQDEPDSQLEQSLIASIRDEPVGWFDSDKDGNTEYAILVLSGGGSAGAFGAGFLSGWTKAGTRPNFKVVTGISTGSLQATFAFLGSEYDDKLTEMYTKYGTDEIYTKRSLLGGLLGESAWDTAPLKELIERYFTDDVLAAVAAKHANGHRLFIGTSNMDTREFSIWDMGAIASSKRTDKLKRYRNVILASCSVPVLFPPVYFDVEVNGANYYEMHVDGGVKSQIFLRGFMLDFKETLEEGGLEDEVEASLYVILNGRADEEIKRSIVEGSSLSIASATINDVFTLSADSSLFRIYVLANRNNIDFNLAAIPDDTFPEIDPMVFDLVTMRKVYDYAFEKASAGYEWAKVPPRLDPDELIEYSGSADRSSKVK